MTIREAGKIVEIWGRYLEFCSKLIVVFGHKIPDSFLPFPKDILDEAIDIIIDQYHKEGNKHMINVLEESRYDLYIRYVNDEEALINAAEMFSNSELRQALATSLKELQQEWIKTQSISK